MAKLGFTVNADEVPEETGGDFETVPPGWYDCVIVDSRMGFTKGRQAEIEEAGQSLDEAIGDKLTVRFDITGPTHIKRVVFTDFYVGNKNTEFASKQAAQVARIANACGIKGNIEEDSDLIGHSCAVRLTVEPGKDGYPAKNRFSGCRAISNEKPSKPDAEPSPFDWQKFAK